MLAFVGLSRPRGAGDNRLGDGIREVHQLYVARGLEIA